MQTLKGLFAPLATPFTDDALSLSEVRFARQIRYLQGQPVSGLVVATDCGEFGTLSSSERKQLVEWVARMATGIPFLVHISSLSTSTSLDLAQHAARHGARAAILMPPYYGKYTSEELIAFFRSVTQYSSLPVIVVDPAEIIGSESHSALHDVPDLVFGLPLETSIACHKHRTLSDEFSIGDCICSPMALIASGRVARAISGEYAELANLISMEETLGGARVSKAGLEVLGIEVGPPRPPLKALSGSVETTLKPLLTSPEDA